jgi:hypothetical protein
MSIRTFVLGSLLLLTLTLALGAEQDDVKPEKLVGWMRTINTVEADYRSSHRRFANAEELFAYSQSAKQISSARALKERLNPAAIQPFVLRVVTDARGEHYSATVKFPSDIHDQSSWCKTEVFSDDSGLISLGQNIECTGANSLGAASMPLK